MKRFFIRIFDFFNTVESKIAFYPSLMAISGFLFALLMMYLEEQGMSRKVMDVLPRLMVENGDTALTILSACLGGLISLMVFSFSMVMLLLSQASNNYSPRLLPGLISDKRHQLILGLFMASIIYIIFTLFSIEPSDEKYAIPGVSVLMGILFTISCLVSFIYFIHNISQSIQINNILDKIFIEAKNRLELLIRTEKETVQAFPNTNTWHSYKLERGGYFQNISVDNILDICDKHATRIYITIPKGLYAPSNAIFLKSEKKLDKKAVDQVVANISFARGELVKDNYLLAFKQITEIAVKAMSPGINDPGTAINAIDYLTELFSCRMQKRDHVTYTSNDNFEMRIATITFRELIYNVMASLRTYCKHDPIMVQKILWMLNYLKVQPTMEESYQFDIEEEIDTMMKQARESLESERDISAIKGIGYN
ncbi:DUF2254 domain-containing protein [Aequorivita sp. H23M31]|uniref:DUF2254 domain-containing protein n=1 Tax=Aequorivita ciconiae TaxID=2494375 RepID=A0A451FS90_9FLAO|nr:DUF2254 domain-containing protein [Aequorivita sp. H23M31]QAA80248.1 DUF2254 domain-containing protein [Aequorivita sp. H23M31]